MSAIHGISSSVASSSLQAQRIAPPAVTKDKDHDGSSMSHSDVMQWFAIRRWLGWLTVALLTACSSRRTAGRTV